MIYQEYMQSLPFLFFFAFVLTLFISYLEGVIFKIRKPKWAHFKNSITTALIAILCVYLYKNNNETDIFAGDPIWFENVVQN
jgi:tellurite resistance protein TehA-like permease